MGVETAPGIFRRLRQASAIGAVDFENGNGITQALRLLCE
jgi:hypothetical protein